MTKRRSPLPACLLSVLAAAVLTAANPAAATAAPRPCQRRSPLYSDANAPGGTVTVAGGSYVDVPLR